MLENILLEYFVNSQRYSKFYFKDPKHKNKQFILVLKDKCNVQTRKDLGSIKKNFFYEYNKKVC